MRGFRFWYFAELFMMLHWGGAIHVSWWWLLYFGFVNMSEYIGFRRDTGMPSLYEEYRKKKGAK